MSRRKGRGKSAKPKDKVAYGSALRRQNRGKRRANMSSERTLKTPVSRENLKSLMHASLAQFMAASGFIRKDEDLIDFDFEAFNKDDKLINVKFRVNKVSEGKKKIITNESFEM